MTRTAHAAPALLDHIVIAGPDLAGVIAWFAERTGVTAAPGGAHPTGTANALVALTVDGQRVPHYIELIGPNPEVEHEGPVTTFGIDGLDAPRIVTYAVHPDDIEQAVASSRARGYDPGEIWDLSRRRPDGELLEWRLTRGSGDFAVPFLIEWGNTPQPGLSDIPTIELVSFERVVADDAALSAVHDALGLGDDALVPLVTGDADPYRLTLRNAQGDEVVL
ncbi:VOC family protein [Microbacterium nymphoidis]|uniref:VOC family protein n=1 Tax=Microbacterium nymphoidis TaxID=2898586 RepID=UPI001E3ED87E|nr:VOC family protein [Microbacterium nymphoidis]MCD2497070.1 VOC family protein [Microbacterium nymphoidis]